MAWYKCSGGGEGIPLITKSGSIVEYEDSVGGVPINDLVADITPIQASGTPSPSNPLTISGYTDGVITRTGKNLFNGTNVINAYISTTIVANNNTRTCWIECKPNMIYTISKVLSARFGVAYTKEFPTNGVAVYNATAKNDQTSITFSTGAEAKYIVAYVYHSSFDTLTPEEIIASVQIELGRTATEYEQYRGTTYSVSFGETVYGGTWKASDGKVVPVGELDLSQQTINYSTTNKRWVLAIPDMKVESERAITWYLAEQWNGDTNANTGDEGKFFSYNGSVYFYTNDGVNQPSGKFIYPLATPTEITVEPVNIDTRQGANNVFANTGNLTAKFYKSSVTNLDTLVEQTKDLAPDIIALASAGDGSTTRVGFDLTEDTTWTKSTRIQNYMFYKNINVEKINLPSILEVGEYAFEDAKYIKGINLPNCTSLKKEAFYNAAQKHTSTTLPSIAINLPAVTVVNDRSLSQIGYTGGLTATLVLTACTEIKANGIRGMGSAYMRIAELLLPSLVTLGQESLNYNVFGTVDIGPNCTSIASKPFNYGTVETLIVRATTPPSLNANGLGVTPTRIKVPAGSLETYQTASNWSNYASIMEAI